MLEYAISAGPGTLVDYGVTDRETFGMIYARAIDERNDVTFTVAASDCETGK